MTGTTSATGMAGVTGVDPSTQDLPFLVVHGAYLWIVVVALAVATVAAAIWHVRRRAARMAALRAAADLERSPGGDTIVRGTLGGDEPGAASWLATLRAVRRSTEEEVVITRRIGALWIDTGAGRVAIDGNVRVIAGSRAAAARHGVPERTTEAHLDDARAEVPWLHRASLLSFASVAWARLDELSPGDAVVARGRLETVPSGAPTGYRESEATAILRTPDSGAIELAARAPRSASPRLAYDVLALVLASTALISWGVMRAAGGASLRACTSAEEDMAFAGADGPLELGETHACAVAAAMPGTRGDALEALHHTLQSHPYRDERALARLAGAAVLVRGCGAGAGELLAAGRLEDAERHARACGDRRTEHVALVSQGRFEEAAKLSAPAEDRLEELPAAATLIAAGRWAEAAYLADRRADAHRLDPALLSPTQERYFRCLAELFRAYESGLETPGRIRTLDDQEPGVCAPMLVELATPSQRRALLSSPVSTRMLGRLQWSAGLSSHEWEMDAAERLLLDPAQAVFDAPLAWLVASERAAWPADLAPETRAGLLRWIAVGQVLDGDLAAAQATVREALALLPGADRPLRLLPFMPALVGLYTPARELPSPSILSSGAPAPGELFARLRMRRGTPSYRTREAFYSAALEEATLGRGGPLAARIRNQAWEEGDVIAVLPRIQSEREDVVRQIRWSSSLRYGSAKATVLRLVLHAFQRRELMKLAGLADEAARWDAIYRRFDAVLGDRRRLIGLLLWDA